MGPGLSGVSAGASADDGRVGLVWFGPAWFGAWMEFEDGWSDRWRTGTLGEVVVDVYWDVWSLDWVNGKRGLDLLCQ